jgi:hypothetical protein
MRSMLPDTLCEGILTGFRDNGSEPAMTIPPIEPPRLRVTSLVVCLLAAVCSSRLPARGGAIDTTVPEDDPRVTAWEREVRALERLDDEPEAVARDSETILFVGSSSIRLWDTIAADMAPLPVTRRGYGGARYRDLCHFVPRLVGPRPFRAIVVFAANDMADPEDLPPVERVMVDVRATHARLREHHPQTPLFFVAVTPTEARWAVWPQIARLNAAIAEMCADEPATHFVATAGEFLDPETGRPSPDLFREDRLHLSAAGYAVWGNCIAEAIEEAAAAGLPAAAGQGLAD